MIAMANGELSIVQSSPEIDPVSFRELVESHKKNVYYLALDLTGNHHDAEADLTPSSALWPAIITTLKIFHRKFLSKRFVP